MADPSTSDTLQLNESTNGVHGSETKLSPAQQRQLEADSQQPEVIPAQRHARKPSTLPNLLSEGDFPSLGKPAAAATKPVSSWGAKRSSAAHATSNGNGTNGRSATSSRDSTPAPTPARIPGAKNLASPFVTENVRFTKNQLASPNGNFSAVCDKVAKFTGVEKITVTRMKVSEVVTFSITGKPDNVIKARNRLQNEVGVKRVENVSTPLSVLPYIIGKKGAVLKNIQDLSGANVKVPKREETDTPAEEDEMVEIQIEGVDAAITKAKEEIAKIVDEKTSRKTEKLDIPADFHLLIAGPNDINIQEWESEDLKIRIPNPHASTDEHIILTGHRDLVAEAKEKIEAKYQQLKKDTTIIKMDLPRSQHRFLIGDRGEGIKSFLAETGCLIIVPPLRIEAGDSVAIRSERSKIGLAVDKMFQQASEITLVTVDFPAIAGDEDHARNVYRYAKRQNLFSKHSTDGVNVSIKGPTNPIEIDGKDAAKVQSVQKSLETLLKSLPREKFNTIEIDPCVHGVLIGKSGKGVQAIKDQFDVYCIFEGQEDPEILLVYEGNESPASSLQAAKEHMQQLAASTADIEEKSIPVPRKYHKIVVGPNGTTLNALIGETASNSIRVYVGGKSRDPEKQDDVVIVRGPSKDVERVAKNIADHVAEAKHTEFLTSHVEEFSIPVDYSKNIIGKGGKRIQELRDRFGVQIKVDEGKVHIQGVKKNAEEARKSIQQIVNELKDDTIERLPVKNEHHGHLIGEKGISPWGVADIGVIVRRLQERYAVRIHFPRREDEEERNSLPDEEKPRNADEIVVRGPSKGVKSAVDELKGLLEYRIQHSHTAEIEILARGRQRLLRNSGGIIHSLRQDPGYVRIDVPGRSEDETDDSVITIRVEGTAPFVKLAVKEIGSLRDEVKGETIRTVTIDHKHHKGLIGPGGRYIQKLIVDAGGPEDRSAQARIVRFPRQGDDSDKIVLTGTPDVVDKIAEKFLEFAARETVEVDVPTDKLSWIIGTGGKKRMELESEFDVTLYVPQVNRGAKGTEKVKITGKPEQNEKAKKAILDIVKSGDGITVQVPKRLHHRVSNDGRTKNQLRQRFQVYVSHDGVDLPKQTTNGNLGRIDQEEEAYSWHIAEDPSDDSDGIIPWKIRGSNDANLQKAKDFLENLVSSMQDQGNCTGYLGVPPAHHYLVIGKGGQRIGLVREETGCTVDVPKKGDGNDTIIIRGNREDVERAKELIVEAVEEGKHRSNGASPRSRR